MSIKNEISKISIYHFQISQSVSNYFTTTITAAITAATYYH